MRIFFTLFCALSFYFTNATDYYVSTSGSDSNIGTSVSSPFLTISHGVSLLTEGDTLFIRGGIYRDTIIPGQFQDGTLSSPITITAYNNENVIIKGSEEVTGWTLFSNGGISAASGVYKITGWTIESQQVFVNNEILKQLGTVPLPIANTASDGMWMIHEGGVNPDGMSLENMIDSGNEKSFFYDSVENALYIRYNGLNPNDFLVEASTISRVVYLRNSDYFHIKGIKFRHSNTSVVKPSAGIIELGDFSVIENCDIQWGDQGGVDMGYQREGGQLINCTISNNGDIGVTASLSNDFIIKDCTVQYNNYRKFNMLWHAGGIKIVSDSWGNVINNEIAFNRGSGLWFDYCNNGSPSNVIANNIHDNGPIQAGLFLEVSRNITVYNNIINHNSRIGISIEASDHLNIFNNEIMNTYGSEGVAGMAGLRVIRDPLNIPSITLSNIYIYNNVFYNNRENCLYDIHVLAENESHGIENIFVDYNLYYNLSNQYQFIGNGTTSTDFLDWQNLGNDVHGIIGDPEYINATNINKNSTSPAIDMGINVGYIDIDYQGRTRPLGTSTDIGASEFDAATATDLPPIANAGSDFVVDAGASFNLDATLSIDDGAITNYLWKNGDTELYSGSDAISPSLTFPDHGIYTVLLTVTDNSGASSIDSVVITVKIPEGELLLHWSFDEGSGTVLDLSSYGNDGTLSASALYVSPGYNSTGSAVSLDGVTGTVMCANSSVVSPNKLTVMSWMYQNPNPEQWYGGVSKANSWNLRATPSNQGFLKWKFELIDVNYIHHILVSTSEVSESSWHHVVGSYDGNMMKLYIDGVLDAERTVTPFTVKDGWQIYAGNSLGRYFFGKIDELKWYNTALSDSEIYSEYSLGTANVSTINVNYKIYPNPTNGVMHIDATDVNIKCIEVIDLLGHISVIKNQQNSSQMTFDLGKKTNGVYLIKIISDKGVYIQKIILKK